MQHNFMHIQKVVALITTQTFHIFSNFVEDRRHLSGHKNGE